MMKSTLNNMTRLHQSNTHGTNKHKHIMTWRRYCNFIARITLYLREENLKTQWILAIAQYASRIFSSFFVNPKDPSNAGQQWCWMILIARQQFELKFLLPLRKNPTISPIHALSFGIEPQQSNVSPSNFSRVSRLTSDSCFDSIIGKTKIATKKMRIRSFERETMLVRNFIRKLDAKEICLFVCEPTIEWRV